MSSDLDDCTRPVAISANLDDETATFDAPKAGEGAGARALPPPDSILEMVKKGDRTLVGLERRLLSAVDGFTTLDRLAPIVGVNVLRARYLAQALVDGGFARVSRALGGATDP